jgi:integrase/recombinase XerD
VSDEGSIFMDRISDPPGVRFSGPLTPLAAGLAAELADVGYAPTTAEGHLRLAAHLSRWLQARDLEPSALTGSVLTEFVTDRRREYSNLISMQALGPTLAYLRRIGMAPAVEDLALLGRVEEVLARFRRYLLIERSITVPVADAYVRWVRPFVQAVAADDAELTFDGVDAALVAGFLAAHLPGLGRKTAQMTASSLRSFLRFLHAEGTLAVDLAVVVPSFAYRRQSGMPQPLSPAQVKSLIGACDPSRPVGRRDLAVVACLLRLGLRCGEVAALRLEDINWADGTLRVHGKGNRVDLLPLPTDVGQAVVDYLRQGRPATAERVVFLTAVAPFTALTRTSVSCIVGRAARRAGLGTIHAHRLRHTTASATLNAGATLEQVAHLLRHASPATTAVYAKTDLSRLATLARPWPTTGSRS